MQTTRHQLEPRRLNIGPCPDNSTPARARTTRHQPGSGQLDIGAGLDDSTSAWARSTWHRSGLERLDMTRAQSTRHRPRPAPLDIDPTRLARHWLRSARLNIDPGPIDSTSAQAWMIQQGPGHRQLNINPGKATQHRPRRLDNGPGLDDSISTRTRLTRHWPTPGWFNICPSPFDSTSTRARETQHWPRSFRLNIVLGLGDSTLAQAQSTRHRPRPTPLDISPGPGDSTLAQACSARHWPGSVQLDIDPGLLGSTFAWPIRLDIGADPTTWHQPDLLDSIGPGQLSSTTTWARLARNRLGPAQLDMGPRLLGYTSAPVRSTRHQLDCLSLT